MATCVVCGKPVVTPAYTQDGSMRHVQCLGMPTPGSRGLIRPRHRVGRKNGRSLAPEDDDGDGSASGSDDP